MAPHPGSEAEAAFGIPQMTVAMYVTNTRAKRPLAIANSLRFYELTQNF